MNSRIGGISRGFFFNLPPKLSFLRSSFVRFFPLRRRPRPVASSGKKGPVIIASHRDCRDRLTHENVIRISLLPTALRNDSTSLCNIVSLFPPLLSFPPPHPTFILSKRFRQSCRSSLSLPREIQHEVGRLRSRLLGNCHKGSIRLMSSAIDIYDEIEIGF